MIKPPIIKSVGLSFNCSKSLFVLKYAINIKITSPKTIPKSKVKAARNPFVILVSNKTKKPGPIEKANRSPQGIAVKISSKCNI